MKLKELISRHPFDELKPMVEQAFAVDLESIYSKLLSMEPTCSEFYLFYDGDQGICGMKKDSNDTYALEYRPWSEWLDMEVPDVLLELGELKVIMLCLDMITLAGFTEEEIAEQLVRLKERIAEADKPDAKFIPAEEVFDKIINKFKNKEAEDKFDNEP